MMRKNLKNFVFLTGLFVLFITGCSQGDKHDALFQASTILALSQGMYEGDLSFYELRQHGDFGLGTFNDLDGEMIALNGVFYQARTDGHLYPVALKKTKTPFSEVVFFKSDLRQLIGQSLTQSQMKATIDRFLRSKNLFYAIKVVGHFSLIKVRSVPAQTKPYPTLNEAVKNQSVFDLSNTDGTLIGFWCPSYAEKINVPGYHFHFISKDKKSGGHVLDFAVTKAEVFIDEKQKVELVLPSTESFYSLDMAKDSPILAEK